MELKKVLLESSLVIIILFAIFYICGWQYYAAVFHSYGLGVYFTLPWESAVAQGISSSLFVIGFATVCGLSGMFVGLALNKRPELRGLHAFILAPVILSLFWLKIMKVMGEPEIRPNIGVWFHLTFAVLLTGLAVYLFEYLIHRVIDDTHPLRNPGILRYCGIFAVVLFIYSSAHYSAQIGKHLPSQIGVKRRASVSFSDDNLQKEFGSLTVVPILEKGEEIVFAKFTDQKYPSQQPVKVTIIKKSLIKSIDYQ